MYKAHQIARLYKIGFLRCLLSDMKPVIILLTICLLGAGCATSKLQTQAAQAKGDRVTKATFFYEVARSNFNVGRYDVALTNLTKAVELNRLYEEAYHARGRTRWCLQDYNGAIADYDEAIALNSKCGGYYCNRGQAKYSLKMVPEALADYNKAIELDSGIAQAYFNRGTLKLVSLSNYSGAIADFTKAIELHNDPQEECIYFWRGNAKLELKDYAGAIADFGKSLELNPNGGCARFATTNLDLARKLLSEFEQK